MTSPYYNFISYYEYHLIMQERIYAISVRSYNSRIRDLLIYSFAIIIYAFYPIKMQFNYYSNKILHI